MVTEVNNLFPQRERLVADGREAHHGLDAGAIARLEGGEAELAGVTEEHNATSDTHRDTGDGVGLDVSEALPQGGNAVGDRDTHRVRVANDLEQPVALGQSNGLLLRHFGLGQLGLRRVRVGHG